MTPHVSSEAGSVERKMGISQLRCPPTWYFPKIGGPEYRHQNTTVVVTGNAKKVTPIGKS